MVFNFPQELKKLKIWLLWRLEHDPKTGRDTKIPYSPITGKAGRVNDTSTWGTYEQALEMLQKYNFSGLGVAFSEEFGIIGIDIDKCLDENGQPNEMATS